MSFEGSDYPRDFLYSDYAVFFEKFGVTLVLIPNAVEKIEDYFDRVSADGVILSGGNDLSSEFTGQPVVDIRNASMLRDRQEKKILDCAVGRKLPVLGICRGMQLLNISRGGTLVQRDRRQGARARRPGAKRLVVHRHREEKRRRESRVVCQRWIDRVLRVA